MSELRSQLESMKGEYSAARYPGDLAAVVLARRRRSHRMEFARWLAISGASASGIAAVLALVVWLGRSDPPVPLAESPVIVPDGIEPLAPVTALAGVPSFPSDVPLTPTAESIVFPTIPAMPSFDLPLDSEFPDAEEAEESV